MTKDLFWFVTHLGSHTNTCIQTEIKSDQADVCKLLFRVSASCALIEGQSNGLPTRRQRHVHSKGKASCNHLTASCQALFAETRHPSLLCSLHPTRLPPQVSLWVFRGRNQENKRARKNKRVGVSFWERQAHRYTDAMIGLIKRPAEHRLGHARIVPRLSLFVTVTLEMVGLVAIGKTSIKLRAMSPVSHQMLVDLEAKD